MLKRAGGERGWGEPGGRPTDTRKGKRLVRRETETKRQQREAETVQALRESHNWEGGEVREAEEDTDRERQRPRREGHRRKFWRREVPRRFS